MGKVRVPAPAPAPGKTRLRSASAPGSSSSSGSLYRTVNNSALKNMIASTGVKQFSESKGKENLGYETENCPLGVQNVTLYRSSLTAKRLFEMCFNSNKQKMRFLCHKVSSLIQIMKRLFLFFMLMSIKINKNKMKNYKVSKLNNREKVTIHKKKETVWPYFWNFGRVMTDEN